MEPNVLLLQIRQTQSKWYQRLFQNDRAALAEPWPSRVEDLNKMLDWSTDLLNVSSPPFQQVFQSEILYSIILIIWPPNFSTAVCLYGKALAFHNAIEYAKSVWTMCMSPNLNLLSSLHRARSLFVGERLLAILRVGPDPIISLLSLQDPPIPSSLSALPKIVKQSFQAQLEDAIRGIQWINAILAALNRRFGDAAESTKFQRESLSVLQLLLSYYTQPAAQTTEVTSRTLPELSQMGPTVMSIMPSWEMAREGSHYMPQQ